MFELKSYAFTISTLLVGLLAFQYCSDKDVRQSIGKHFVAVVVITQAAAFLSPNLIVYNLIAGLSLLVTCSKRQTIAPTYVFLLLTLPMTPRVIAAGSTYIMSYDVGVSLGVAALTAIVIRSKGQFSRAVIWDVPAWLLFLLFLFANGRSTSATNLMRVALEQGSTMLLPYYVISRSMRSFDDLRGAFYGLAAAVTALSTLAIYEAVRGWPLYRVVSSHYGIILTGGASVKIRGGLLRSPASFDEPTSFALCLALGLLFAIGCRRLFASRTKQQIVIAIMSVGILAPQSRGAWFGLAIGIVAMDVYNGRYAALGKKIGVAAIGVLGVLALAQIDSRVESAAGLNAEGQGTAGYRSNLLDRGIEEVKAHPLTGRKMDDVRLAMRDMTQGEGIIDFVNTYLFVALLAGIPGLMIFVICLTSPLATLWRAQHSFSRRYLATFRRLSSASVVAGSGVAMALMIALTAMVGRTTIMVVVLIGFSSVIMNNMRAARRAMIENGDPGDGGAGLVRAAASRGGMEPLRV